MSQLNSTIANSDVYSNNVVKHEKTIAIIPAFNESKNIIKIINEVKKYVNEIIVIDDGSKDDTYEKALSTNVIVLRNNKNKGKGVALRKGLNESFKHNADVIVTIDADGQHDPSEIPKLIKPIIDKQADIVIGSRYHKNSVKEIPLKREMGLTIINILNKTLMKSNIKDSQSGFRAYHRLVFGIISDYESKGYGVESEQLALAESHGINIMEIPVTIKYKGIENPSKTNPIIHGIHLVSTILKITVEQRPLLFFGLGGIALIIISLIPLSNLLMIFNETRYFSIPLALIVMGLVFIGSLLIVVSFILYALKRLRFQINTRNL